MPKSAAAVPTALTTLTSKVDENKKKMGEYVKNWQFV